jgi:hypothetical protein
MKVTITNFTQAGEPKFPHGLEAQLLIRHTDDVLKCIRALGYVETTDGKRTTRIVVPLFNAGPFINEDMAQPWILTDWFSFPNDMPASSVDHWVDMLVFKS